MMRVTRGDWLRSAAKPRMLALLVLVLAGAVVFIQLGAWQLDRAALRGASEAKQITAERLAAAPVPLEGAIQVGDTFMQSHQLLKVAATGEWGRDVLVPNRVVEGVPAVLVVSEFVLSDESWIPVLRGWLPAAELPADPVKLPAAAAALVAVPQDASVIGYLSASEDTSPGVYPPGTAGSISSAALANLWGGATYTGFIVAIDGAEWSLETMPPPSYAQEQGMNLQNLFYAGEWFIFGGFALFMWWRWVKDDALRVKEAALLAAGKSV